VACISKNGVVTTSISSRVGPQTREPILIGPCQYICLQMLMQYYYLNVILNMHPLLSWCWYTNRHKNRDEVNENRQGPSGVKKEEVGVQIYVNRH
jgi:hypothetical protein